jgi:2,4-dienoyl-CoA reductase (NADPH2)
MNLVRYYKTQFKKLGVNVKLGREVNKLIVKQLNPDVIIIAVGGKHNIPIIPGIQGSKVLTGTIFHKKLKFILRFLSPTVLEKLTRFYMPIRKRVIVIGSTIHGCELTEFLIKRGRQVTIVDSIDSLGEGMTGDDMSQLFPWFDKKGVKRYLGAKYKEITSKGLSIINKEGQELIIEADTIITALPLQCDTDLKKSLSGKVSEIYLIGDCKEPKLIADAIADGALVANSI